MAQLRELKGRIKAVGNIKRITKTMQMIATAKFQASVRRATETKPYTDKVAQLVGELAAAAGTSGLDHPLLRTPDPKTGRELLLVITSNRGLCGAYNANVLRQANSWLRTNPDTTFDIHVVGKKGIGFFRFAGHTVARSYTDFGDAPSYDHVDGLASEFMKQFEQGQYDAVRVCYMKFITNSRQEPMVEQLLPLEKPEAAGDAAEADTAVYDFSPEPAELLAELLPITVKTRLFQAFNDAVVSEQVARMVAMKAATDNADEMGRNLRRSFNRARQAQITTELTEIVGGAAALE
jgi:F-type H+-transporting ATPase subunit gamma